MNKIRCPHGISPKGNCDICYKESRKKYCQSLEYKERRRESRKKYYQSHRQQILERQKRYHQSPKYKESIKKYQQSPKYKEYHKKYMRLYNSKIFNPSPAKPESPSKPDTDITSVNAKTPLFEASQESASPNGKSSTESTQQTETGGGFIRASPFVCKGIKRTKNGKGRI